MSAARDVDLLVYLTPKMQEYYELQKIADAENPEFNYLWGVNISVRNDIFILTATEEGLRRYEEMLDLVPDPNDSFEARRARIQGRFLEQLPITERSLRQQLTIFCGENGFDLDINHNAYELTIKLALTSKRAFSDVEAMLRRTIPANLTVSLSLWYNQHQTLRRFTHAEMAAFTHQHLREGVLP